MATPTIKTIAAPNARLAKRQAQSSKLPPYQFHIRVDSQFGIAIARADREHQPGIRNAGNVLFEGVGRVVVVTAVRRFVGKARSVAEQHAQGDLLLGVFLKDTVGMEIGQVGTDSCRGSLSLI
jgi:hypothetical protein